MKNKKILIIFIIIILLIGGIAFYLYFGKEDKKTTLTANERQWIENNKNRLIDLSIPSDAPILSNNGEGVIFDFLADLEEKTGLEFNKISYANSEKPISEYALKAVPQRNNNDILIYQDNYILVGQNNIKFVSTSEIKNLVVGVLEDDLETISKNLPEAEVTYKTYKDKALMINDLKNNTLNLIALPKIASLDTIIKDKKLNIAYNITEYTNDYVLTLGNENILNKILKKYYLKWSKENFEEDFDKNLANNYFTAKKIGEKEQVKFRSKRYNYGFVNNSPFDITTREGLKGFNYSLLSEFAKSTNIEINYKKYSNIDTLVKEFGENKLDIIFNYSSNDKYNMDVYNTISVYDEKVVLISNQNTNLNINSINSLAGKTIYCVKDSKIESYLKENGVNTKTFDNVDSLINRLNGDNLAVIDYYTYDYYVRNELNTFKNLYTFNIDKDYNFISRDTSTNETFNELFNYYLSFINSNQILNNSYKELLEYNNNNKLFRLVIALLSAILLMVIGIITGKFVKKHRNPHPKLTKNDKLRYIDTLTSLKNRNYLNENIDSWDSSKIYPQTIIIIDLNNIAYINDNFGHAEGDKVIVEAAGILINNQLPNSDIIRTNGNEFLIFVLEQDEKRIISYIRKLHKQFKNISHGFGAEIGYSIITDEIKTIDDAINEATLDMRNNKDENKQ